MPCEHLFTFSYLIDINNELLALLSGKPSFNVAKQNGVEA